MEVSSEPVSNIIVREATSLFAKGVWLGLAKHSRKDEGGGIRHPVITQALRNLT